MNVYLAVDIAAKTITRVVNGADVSESSIGFTARDTLTLAVKFYAGETDLTSQILGTEVNSQVPQMLVGMRQYPSYGALLAQSSSYSYDSTNLQGLCTFDLNTSEALAFVDALPTQATSGKVYLEVEVYVADGSWRQRFAQQQVALYCEVDEESDEPPAAAATSAANASTSATDAAASAAAAAISAASPLRNAVTLTGIASSSASSAKLCGLATAAAALAVGTIVIAVFNVGSQPVIAAFQLTAGSGTTPVTASAPWVSLPYDYSATTNNVYWQLLWVRYGGQPAMWNPTTGLFHYIEASGAAGSVTVAVDQTGFSLPT